MSQEMDPEELLLLKDAARRSREGIESSAVFLSIFTEEAKEDPIFLMQMALAILLDKPVYIIAPVGATIPENILRLSRGIKQADFDDRVSFEVAAAWLAREAREAGFFKSEEEGSEGSG